MASKRMAMSRKYTRSIEARAKAAIVVEKPTSEPIEPVIADDILAMDNDTLAKALIHARRSCRVMPDRQNQLQVEWRKRLAALDDE